MQDEFFSEKIETFEIKFHYTYRELYKDKLDSNLKCMLQWENLDDEYKNSIRDKVKYIPNALHKINYDIMTVKEKAQIIEFTEKDLEILAHYEHKRWLLEKKRMVGNMDWNR